MDITKTIELTGIVPVIKLDDALEAPKVARALSAGGIPVAEVTFRTAAAEESIRRICAEVPGVLVGAGSVTTTEQVTAAKSAGAKFIVSPGINPRIVEKALEMDLPIIPGCSSPSNIETALEFGLSTVKFFPAEASGGLTAIKAMAAPYTGVRFMPTGGINLSNIVEYLSFKKVIACGGSWMVKDDYINSGRFDLITEACRTSVAVMLGFEMAHIGIYCDGEDEASQLTDRLCELFFLPRTDGASSIFCGSVFELMKQKDPTINAHIAISANSVERAVYFLERMGLEADESTARYSDGKLTVVYFKEQLGGFAFHLLQKK